MLPKRFPFLLTAFLASLLPTLVQAEGPTYPARVYVPNQKSHTLQVIDPGTFETIATYPMARGPHHVTPSWDLKELYVNNTIGNQLAVIDPASGKVTRTIEVTDPYNLYFTPDGTRAIVVAERHKRLDIRDLKTWKLVKSIPIPDAGANHLAISHDGSYLVVSTEFSGWLYKVDLNKLEVVDKMNVGGQPIDVIRLPHSNIMYVANQTKAGMQIIDPDAWKQIGYIKTGAGAHGILPSHDRKQLYVSNRNVGTITVVDVASRKAVATWRTGGSPDMGQLSPDGKQFWLSSRYHKEVMVIDTETGKVIKRIPAGNEPHGLTYFPNSKYSHNLGHNGVYRED